MELLWYKWQRTPILYNYRLIRVLNRIEKEDFCLLKLLVKEDWITRAMLHLQEREKYIVEGAAACTLAAILGNLVPELKSKKYVSIVLRKQL